MLSSTQAPPVKFMIMQMDMNDAAKTRMFIKEEMDDFQQAEKVTAAVSKYDAVCLTLLSVVQGSSQFSNANSV